MAVTRTPAIKVADYRLLCDGLSRAFAGLRSARSDRPAELAREADWARRSARELLSANCPRASKDDRDMADRPIDASASSLVERGL